MPTADSANGGGRVRKVNLIAAMSDFVVRTEPDRWREPPEFGAVSTMAWRHRFPLFGNRATTPGSPPVCLMFYIRLINGRNKTIFAMFCRLYNKNDDDND